VEIVVIATVVDTDTINSAGILTVAQS